MYIRPSQNTPQHIPRNYAGWAMENESGSSSNEEKYTSKAESFNKENSFTLNSNGIDAELSSCRPLSAKVATPKKMEECPSPPSPAPAPCQDLPAKAAPFSLASIFKGSGSDIILIALIAAIVLFGDGKDGKQSFPDLLLPLLLLLIA